MNIQFEGLPLFLLVLTRLTGMVLLNPLLARRNVPSQVRMGFVLCLTILIAPLQPPLVITDMMVLMIEMVRELVVGFLCGYVFQVFYFLLFFVGDLMDTEFGMSMAKVFDPGTNIQMSVSGNFLSIMFMVYIFLTDSHLILIQIFAQSFRLLPIGTAVLSEEVLRYAIELFIAVFSLVFRLALPFVVAEFTLEAAMGVLMKVIPQITIFVINFQLKLLLGMTMLILYAPVISSFLDRYTVLLFENMQHAIELLAG